jgi:hypothetical protein
MLGRGELDSQTALELSTLTRAWISARHEREELQLKLSAHGGQPTLIRIEGGLPELPGTNIIMPEMNAELNGKTIDHDPPRPAIEATDQETNAGPAPPPAEDQGP